MSSIQPPVVPAALTAGDPPRKLVPIGKHGEKAKVRGPLAVVGLSIITLGIYYLVWYYKVNRELCDYGEAHQVDLGMSALTSLIAITLGGFLIVPPFVSLFHTGKRVMGAQRIAGVRGASAALFLLVGLIPLIGWLIATPYLQSQLNKVWRAVPGLGLRDGLV